MIGSARKPRAGGRVHPVLPGLVLLVSCLVVNALDHGAPRLVAALLGLGLSALLFLRAYGPTRFFRDAA